MMGSSQEASPRATVALFTRLRALCEFVGTEISRVEEAFHGKAAFQGNASKLRA
jgi:hypothetical protein